MPAKDTHTESRPAVSALLRTTSRHLDQELVGELGVRSDDGGRREVPRFLHLVGGQFQLPQLAVDSRFLWIVESRYEEPVLLSQAFENALAILLALEG